MTLAEKLKLLDQVWKGWCQDAECSNNPSHGLKPGTPVRIKVPAPSKPYHESAGAEFHECEFCELLTINSEDEYGQFVCDNCEQNRV